MAGSDIATITLNAGRARAEIVPDLGGGMAGLWLDDLPVLRPWSQCIADGPFALALNILAPFSNRISGGFTLDGARIALQPNMATEPLPIHGDAFARSWAVAAQEAQSLVLVLDAGAIGPWRYQARLTYTLTDTSLTLALELTNKAAVTLPYGLGFHPWFPRNAQTRLRFYAGSVWYEDDAHLPRDPTPAPIPLDWQFAQVRALPDGWINNGFADWDGHADIMQADGAQSVCLRATDVLTTAIVYSPAATADFFCFEPVSHGVDAINLPQRPGLMDLAPQDQLHAQLQFIWP